jgi:hypothetical protein
VFLLQFDDHQSSQSEYQLLGGNSKRGIGAGKQAESWIEFWALRIQSTSQTCLRLILRKLLPHLPRRRYDTLFIVFDPLESCNWLWKGGHLSSHPFRTFPGDLHSPEYKNLYLVLIGNAIHWDFGCQLCKELCLRWSRSFPNFTALPKPLLSHFALFHMLFPAHYSVIKLNIRFC